MVLAIPRYMSPVIIYILVGNSISEDQTESDKDLEDGFFSDDEIYSDSDDGDYFSTGKSLEGTLDFGSFKSFPVLMHQLRLCLGADLLSTEVPDPSDKWEDDDFGFCLFDEMPLTMMSCFPALLVLLAPLLVLSTVLKMFLGDIPHLNTYFLQSHLMVTMQFLFVLS